MNQKNDKLPFETEKEYKLRRLLEWADRRGLTEDIAHWTINDLAIFIDDLFKIRSNSEE